MSMIIKGIRLRSASGISRTIRHLENGNENDAVDYVAGTAADIRDMHRDAVSIGSRYAVRHWIIAPHESTTRQQAMKMVGAIAQEFAFDPARAVVVEHRKRRSTNDAVDVHWHVLVGEVDPTTGRILATSYDRIRHELIARMAEFAFGHAFVPGKHTDAVIKGLRKRGLHCVADRVEKFIASFPAIPTIPAEAFTHARHQETKRLGIDLPALKQTIKQSVDHAHCQEDIVSALTAVGLEVKAGDKPGIWIVVNAESGVLLGALHRLAGVQKSAINDLMLTNAPRESRERQDAVDASSPSENLPLADQQPAASGSDAIGSKMRISERLTDLENTALKELELPIPNFQPTAAMQTAREVASIAADDLSQAVMRRTELDIQLAKIPRVRWWSHLTGAAERQRKKTAELELSLEDIGAEISRKEMAVTISRRKEIQEEKAAKESHAATVFDLAQRQKHARGLLAVLEHAKVILEKRPEASAKGLDFILAAANASLRRSNAIADQLHDLDAGRKIVR
jgi:hypothetical protein